MQKSVAKIISFIQQKIVQTQKCYQSETNLMQKLKLAIVQISYANILSQYLDNNKAVFPALIRLSEAYMNTQSYAQALVQARLAKKQVENSKNGQKQKAVLLIVECLLKTNKHQDAYDVLSSLKQQEIPNLQVKKYYQILLSILVQLGQQNKIGDTLIKFQSKIKEIYGNKANQYGFFLVKKGECLGNFQKYQKAIGCINQGLDILISKKCGQKKKITQIYLKLSQFHRKLNNLEKQYCSLVCANSMAKQLDDPELVLSILHSIVANLLQREQNAKALKELKLAKSLQKQRYGQSSAQMAKTIKKIIYVLELMNMSGEAKKYQQQYSRVIGSYNNLINLRQKPSNIERK